VVVHMGRSLNGRRASTSAMRTKAPRRLELQSAISTWAVHGWSLPSVRERANRGRAMLERFDPESVPCTDDDRRGLSRPLAVQVSDPLSPVENDSRPFRVA
jgi:hypothetical protein